jgi:hypothetical protein
MRHELWYTSAPRGLDLGRSGFCTVKVTRGMPTVLRELLERMSEYRHVFPPGHKRAGENPVVVSCVGATIGGTKWRIISRICDAGADHTNRTNFFAHHIAYDAAEGPRDPAWLASQPNIFAQRWDSRTEELAQCRELPAGTESRRPCAAWRAACGDAGWAGAVADAILEHSSVYIVSDGTISLVPLIVEVASLLPKSRRTELTFSTLYSGSSSGLNCTLRCVVTGSDEAKRAGTNGAVIFNLTDAAGKIPPETLRVSAARTGGPDETIDSALPESFIANALDPVGAPRIPRETGKASNEPRPQAQRTLSTSASFSDDADASRAWLPVISGIGGIALCALVLSPLILWFRAENLKQQASISKLGDNVEAIQKDLDKQKKEKSDFEKDRDALKIALVQSEHQAKLAQISSEQKLKEKSDDVERLNTQHNDDAKTHADDTTKVKALDQKIKELSSAAQKPVDTAPTPKETAPPNPVAKKEEPNLEPVRSRLPPLSTSARAIEIFPRKPSTIELVGADGFQIVPKREVWEMQYDGALIAKLSVHEDKPNFLLRFNWEQQAGKGREKNELDKLVRASLKVSLDDGVPLFIPLYFPLTPPKDSTQAISK